MKKKKGTRRRRAWHFSDDVVFTVTSLRFSEGLKPVEIVVRMRKERGVFITREQVYDIIEEAHSRGFLQINCPLELAVANRLADAYGISRAVDVSVAPPVQVVNVPAVAARRELARQAGETAHRLILEIAERKGPSARVHLAFASGNTTHTVLRCLAETIRKASKDFPKLTLHAACPGISVSSPENTPGNAFALFENLPIDVEFVGFNSVPIVRSEQYQEHKDLPGLSEAFARAHEVDVLITSMGWADDEDGEIRRLFSQPATFSTAALAHTDCDAGADAGRRTSQIDVQLGEYLATLRRRGWVGDVQYQPYSPEGPLDTGVEFRAVTLFSIPDLVALAAKPNKAVLLVCGPCVKPHRSRSEALVPLLENPDLRVWSHLVIDRRTAEECTAMAAGWPETA